MAYRDLSDIVPSADDLLSLELEELGGVLLEHLNSSDGSPGSSVFQNRLVSSHNFFLRPSDQFWKPEYGDRQDEVDTALRAAWAWLESTGLLVRHPEAGPNWFSISP